MYKLILINSSWCIFMKKGGKDCIHSLWSPSVSTSASPMNFTEQASYNSAYKGKLIVTSASLSGRAFIHVQRCTNLYKFVP